MYLLDRYLLISGYALRYLGKQITSRTYARIPNYPRQHCVKLNAEYQHRGNFSQISFKLVD